MPTKKKRQPPYGFKGNKKQRLERAYHPPAWGHRLVEAYLDVEVKPTITARCAYAGIDRGTFYRHIRSEPFVEWLTGQLQKQFTSEFFDVRQAHLKACMSGNLDAIKLWYEMAGQYLPTTKIVHENEDSLEGLSDRECLEIGMRLLDEQSDDEEPMEKVDSKKVH